MKRFSFLLITLLAMTACTNAPGIGSGTDKADELFEGEVPQVAGTYGYVLRSTVVVCETDDDSDVCEDDKRSTGTVAVHGIVSMTQDETVVEGSFQACRIQFTDEDGDAQSDLDYLNNEDTLRGLGELASFSGNFISTEDGPILDTGLIGFIIGAELSSPVGEDMPTDEDDARVIDHDNDGKPGVTLDAPLGKIYMGLRVIVDAQLTVSEDGNLLGPLNAHALDVSVYDDTVPFVNVAKKLKKTLRTNAIASQEHQLHMVPGVVDCEEILATL